MQDNLPPGRMLNPAEIEHIRLILFPHQKRGRTISVALICILIVADILSAVFIFQGYRDIRFFILLGAGNILTMLAWFNIRRNTFLKVRDMHAVPVEGAFSIAKIHSKRGESERYLIGEFPLILPGNWVESFKPGEHVAGEIFPLANGYCILLTVHSKGLHIG